MDKQTISASATWLQLALRALSLVQAFLPSFFVAWSDHLYRKNRELQQRLDEVKMKQAVAKEQEAIRKKNIGKDSRTIVNDFLKR